MVNFQVIKWHVVLKFINIDKRISVPAVSETTKLWQLLSDFVEFRSEDDPADPFQMYRSLSYGGLSLYLKAGGYSFTEMNNMDRKKVFKNEKMFLREPKLSDFILNFFQNFFLHKIFLL